MGEERLHRRLAAILAADIVGYSRMMGREEAATLAAVKALRADVLDPQIGRYGGRIFKTTGDGALAEFPSAVDAVQAAIEVQRALAGRNEDVPPERRIELRIGISLGDVIVEGSDLYGNGVNVAARMEGLARPGGICVSGNVHEHAVAGAGFEFEDLGDQAVKNIDRPVRAYRIEVFPRNAAPPSAPDGDAAPRRPSIAVLPFVNMSGDPEQEYFADGMAEDIITGLSRFHWFFVIARNSSFSYKGASPDVRRVAGELGVQYVLEGSVRKAGDRIRVTAQLIDAASGRHVWAERYDRRLDDIFAVQDEITAMVVAAIEPQLYSAEESRAKRKPPESLDAWESVVRALALINGRTQETNAAAQTLLDAAIALDPQYAQAFGLLAYAVGSATLYGWQDRETGMKRAREAADRAVRLDRDDPWAHFAAGFVAWYDGKPEDAVAAYGKALTLNPNFAAAHAQLGGTLGAMGQSDEALAELDMAERLSPRDVFTGLTEMFRSRAYFATGRYRDGIDAAHRSLRESPSLVTAYCQLVGNCVWAGEIEDAKAALAALRRLVPDLSLKDAGRLSMLFRTEDRQRLEEAFRRAGLE